MDGNCNLYFKWNGIWCQNVHIIEPNYVYHVWVLSFRKLSILIKWNTTNKRLYILCLKCISRKLLMLKLQNLEKKINCPRYIRISNRVSIFTIKLAQTRNVTKLIWLPLIAHEIIIALYNTDTLYPVAKQ